MVRRVVPVATALLAVRVVPVATALLAVRVVRVATVPRAVRVATVPRAVPVVRVATVPRAARVATALRVIHRPARRRVVMVPPERPTAGPGLARREVHSKLSSKRGLKPG